MDDELMHELAGAYVVDALSPEEERAYEAHLARCERCQEEVAAFTETAASLAFSVPALAPPVDLRERIAVAARADRAQVVPLRPRWAYPAVAAAAVAACAAIGLGIWASSLHSRLGTATSAMQTFPLKGASGSLLVAGNHQATLVVSGLPRAPHGKTYEVWVMRAGGAQPAGLFSATAATTTLHLSRAVPAGARVGVTLERAGGSPTPTTAPVVLSAPV
jgi:anti-sigma-K factor RskA